MDSVGGNSKGFETRELLFLVAKFLEASPCQEAAEVLKRELDQNGLLPACKNWLGEERQVSYKEVALRTEHAQSSTLPLLCSKLLYLLEKHGHQTHSLLGSRATAPISSLEISTKTRGEASDAVLKAAAYNRELTVGFREQPVANSCQLYSARQFTSSLSRGALCGPNFYQGLKKHCSLLGHLAPVFCVLFDHTGEIIITGADDDLIKIWSSRTGQLLATLRGHTAEVCDLSLSYDNTMIASGSLDKSVRVWCAQTSATLAVLTGHQSPVTSVQFSPASNEEYRYLASTAKDGFLCFWQWLPDSNTFSSSPIKFMEKNRMGDQTLCSCFSPGGKYFATGGTDRFLRVYVCMPGPPILLAELPAHSDRIMTVQFGNTSEGLLATGSCDGTAGIWRFTENGWKCSSLLKMSDEEMSRFLYESHKNGRNDKSQVTMVGWESTDRYLVVAISPDCHVRVWCASTGTLLRKLQAHTGEVFVLEPHPLDSRILLTAGHDGYIVLWDMLAGVKLNSFKLQPQDLQEDNGVRCIFDCKFSPDGTMCAAADRHGYLNLFGFGSSEAYKHPIQQFFHTDYHPLLQDRNHYVIDETTQLPPHLLPPPYLVDIDGNPYPSHYQEPIIRQFRPAPKAQHNQSIEEEQDYDEYMRNRTLKLRQRAVWNGLGGTGMVGRGSEPHSGVRNENETVSSVSQGDESNECHRNTNETETTEPPLENDNVTMPDGALVSGPHLAEGSQLQDSSQSDQKPLVDVDVVNSENIIVDSQMNANEETGSNRLPLNGDLSIEAAIGKEDQSHQVDIKDEAVSMECEHVESEPVQEEDSGATRTTECGDGSMRQHVESGLTEHLEDSDAPSRESAVQIDCQSQEGAAVERLSVDHSTSVAEEHCEAVHYMEAETGDCVGVPLDSVPVSNVEDEPTVHRVDNGPVLDCVEADSEAQKKSGPEHMEALESDAVSSELAAKMEREGATVALDVKEENGKPVYELKNHGDHMEAESADVPAVPLEGGDVNNVENGPAADRLDVVDCLEDGPVVDRVEAAEAEEIIDIETVEHAADDNAAVEHVDGHEEGPGDNVEGVRGEPAAAGGGNIRVMLSSLVYSLGLGEMETKEAISLWQNRTIIPPLDIAHLSTSLARRRQLYDEEETHYQDMLERGREVAPAAEVLTSSQSPRGRSLRSGRTLVSSVFSESSAPTDDESSASEGISLMDVWEQSSTDSGDISDWTAQVTTVPLGRKRTRRQRRRTTVSDEESDEGSKEGDEEEGMAQDEGTSDKTPPPKSKKKKGRDYSQYAPPGWVKHTSPQLTPYLPQVGDIVVYCRQGHELYLNDVVTQNIYISKHVKTPWQKYSLLPQEFCQVTNVRWCVGPPTLCSITLSLLSSSACPIEGGASSSHDKKVVFSFKYHDMDGVLDFLILDTVFKSSVQKSWEPGDHFQSLIDGSYWKGTVIEKTPFSQEFPNSHWQCYRVRWEDGIEDQLSPWDMHSIDTDLSAYIDQVLTVPTSSLEKEWGGANEPERILSGFEIVMGLDEAHMFREPVSPEAVPNYCTVVAFPTDLGTIKTRLEKHFYRRKMALLWEVVQMWRNAIAFNRKDSLIVDHCKVLVHMLWKFISSSDPDPMTCYEANPVGEVGQEVMVTPPPLEEFTITDALLPSSTTAVSSTEEMTSEILWLPEAEQLLKLISDHHSAPPFLQPVDTDVYEDYLQVISIPMDLSTVEHNLHSGQYTAPEDIISDLKLIFKNAKTFNRKGSVVYKMATELQSFLEPHLLDFLTTHPGPTVVYNTRSALSKVASLAAVRGLSSSASVSDHESVTSNHQSPIRTSYRLRAKRRRSQSSDSDVDVIDEAQSISPQQLYSEVAPIRITRTRSRVAADDQYGGYGLRARSSSQRVPVDDSNSEESEEEEEVSIGSRRSEEEEAYLEDLESEESPGSVQSEPKTVRRSSRYPSRPRKKAKIVDSDDSEEEEIPAMTRSRSGRLVKPTLKFS